MSIISWIHERFIASYQPKIYQAPHKKYFLIHGIFVQNITGIDNTLKILDVRIDGKILNYLIAENQNAIIEFDLNNDFIQYLQFSEPIKTKYISIGFTSTTTVNMKITVLIYYSITNGTKNELIYDFIRKSKKS